MAEKLIRIFCPVKMEDIEKHLIVFGTLSASCAKCNEMGIKLEEEKCPKCGTEFTFITFRNFKEHMPKIKKIAETRPEVKIIDYDDYKRLAGQEKARGLFND